MNRPLRKVGAAPLPIQPPIGPPIEVGPNGDREILMSGIPGNPKFYTTRFTAVPNGGGSVTLNQSFNVGGFIIGILLFTRQTSTPQILIDAVCIDIEIRRQNESGLTANPVNGQMFAIYNTNPLWMRDFGLVVPNNGTFTVTVTNRHTTEPLDVDVEWILQQVGWS